MGDYYYDPLGRRSGKDATIAGSTTSTEYLWSGSQVMAEYDGTTGALLRRYVYGPGIDTPLVMLDASDNKTYLHGDRLGSIIAVASSTGAQIEAFTSGPYGEDTSESNSPYKFAARRIDQETGLYYNRARYYNPGLGRFMSNDPIGYGDGLNMYAYVGNDPLNYTDPFGLYSEEVIVRAPMPCHLRARSSSSLDGDNRECRSQGFTHFFTMSDIFEERYGDDADFYEAVGNGDAKSIPEIVVRGKRPKSRTRLFCSGDSIASRQMCFNIQSLLNEQITQEQYNDITRNNTIAALSAIPVSNLVKGVQLAKFQLGPKGWLFGSNPTGAAINSGLASGRVRIGWGRGIKHTYVFRFAIDDKFKHIFWTIPKPPI